MRAAGLYKQSDDIECSIAPESIRSGEVDDPSMNGGECLDKGESALGEGTSPNLCSDSNKRDAENIPTQERPLKRVRWADLVETSTRESPSENDREAGGEASIGVIISPEGEEEMRRKGEKKDAIAYATEEEIDKMIEDAKITPEEKRRLKEMLMRRRETFAEDFDQRDKQSLSHIE